MKEIEVFELTHGIAIEKIIKRYSNDIAP